MASPAPDCCYHTRVSGSATSELLSCQQRCAGLARLLMGKPHLSYKTHFSQPPDFYCLIFPYSWRDPRGYNGNDGQSIPTWSDALFLYDQRSHAEAVLSISEDQRRLMLYLYRFPLDYDHSPLCTAHAQHNMYTMLRRLKVKSLPLHTDGSRAVILWAHGLESPILQGAQKFCLFSRRTKRARLRTT